MRTTEFCSGCSAQQTDGGGLPTAKVDSLDSASRTRPRTSAARRASVATRTSLHFRGIGPRRFRDAGLFQP